MQNDPSPTRTGLGQIKIQNFKFYIVILHFDI